MKDYILALTVMLMAVFGGCATEEELRSSSTYEYRYYEKYAEFYEACKAQRGTIIIQSTGGRSSKNFRKGLPDPGDWYYCTRM